MSEPRGCDLCGLAVGAHPYVLATTEKTYEFCCEGCLGIYKMLNNVQEPAGQPPNRMKSSN
jgi:hypothetical protein